MADSLKSAVSRPGAWILAARPKTLTAAFVPIAVSLGLAGPSAPLRLAFFALACALFIQVGTNLTNDAFDFTRGADTGERSGPKRVTQAGIFAPSLVLAFGIACFLISLCLAIPLVIAGGWPIVAIALASVVCGFLYTGGPYPLAYAGLGDVFTFLFFGAIAVSGMSFLFHLHMGTQVAAAAIQVGSLSTVMIAINNARDEATDRVAHKRTLAVRFGLKFVRIEIAALLTLPFILGVFWWKIGAHWAALLPLFTLPLAFKLGHAIATSPPSSRYNSFLAQASLLNLSFGLLLTMGLWKNAV